jgi:hypothetical protein
MPIYRFLRESAYGPDETRVMTEAYERFAYAAPC